MPVRRVQVLLTLSASLLVVAVASAQTGPLAVPGYPVATSVPGAHALPDPHTTHKVVFDVTHKADQPDHPLPGLLMVARYINTLSQYGVPASHRPIAVVFHQDALDVVVNNDTWKAAHNGADNPNIPLIQALAKAGVVFHVCGQGVTRTHIATQSIQREIQLDLWALTTLIDLQQQGYVRVGD
jgi:intracellular sulfur oxidation DsrE/DsrF family protein